MVVGEDKNKVAGWLDVQNNFQHFFPQVANIVRPQMERFRHLYKSRVAASKEFLQVLQHIYSCGHQICQQKSSTKSLLLEIKIFYQKQKSSTRKTHRPYCEPCDCAQINSGECEQDCGHLAKLHHLELLPLAVAERYLIHPSFRGLYYFQKLSFLQMLI